MRSFLVFSCLIFSFGSFVSYAQLGKDGAGNITTNTNVNVTATNLAADVAAGNKSIQVISAANFTSGDLVMIYQAQGAEINTSKDDESWGAITNMQNAGGYEFVEVASVSGTTITLKTGLDKTYNYSRTINGTLFNNLVQIIKVPRYKNLTVGSGAVLSPSPWDGKTGGVTVMEIDGDLTLNGTIDVSGKGFRGGAIETGFGTKNNIGVFHTLNNDEGALKGESVVGNKAEYTAYGGSYGRGAVGNGGGGGNGHNSAGGGGANAVDMAGTLWNGLGNPDPKYNQYWSAEKPFGNATNVGGIANVKSSGGGRGGYSWSNQDLDPVNGTSLTAWGKYGGDTRDNVGGYGGRPLPATVGKAFLGGGGGTGSHDNDKTLPGGNGGGLVIILCNGKIIGNGAITANGSDGGNDSPGNNNSADAPSGAGGGGSVILKATFGVGGSVNIQANGGKGGNQNYPYVEAEGAGGGGGGGYVAQFNTAASSGISIVNQGGSTGITTTQQSMIRTNFPPNGATIGGSGASASFPIQPATAICQGKTATIALSQSVTDLIGTNISWYDAQSEGTKLPGSGPGSGNPWTSPILTNAVSDTFYYDNGTNGIDTRFAVIVPINSIAVQSSSITICQGTSGKLTATGGDSYTWAPSPDLSSTTGSSVTVTPSASPSYYYVTGTKSGCTKTIKDTVTIQQPPVVLAPPVAAICPGETAVLSASGADSYVWDPSTGLNTTTGATIKASPTTTQTYNVTGKNGCGTDKQSVTVNVKSVPQTTVKPVTICTGASATLIATGDQASYVWAPAATLDKNSGSQVIATLPSGTLGVVKYTVTATGSTAGNQNCVGMTIAIVNINPLPQLSVNSPTICNGQSTTLTVTGANTYLWTPSNSLNVDNKPVVVASPTISTTYTITGKDTNGCMNTTQSVVTVVPKIVPHVTDSVLICKGDVADLSASGGGNYLWSTNETTAAIQVKPEQTRVYKVVISNDACKDSGNVKVIVKETDVLFFNPNSFTPNNDKLNDIYQVYSPNAQDIAEFTTEIFDRWGELIYKWTALSGGWDGRMNGTIVKDDVYVCKISIVDQCKHTYKRVGIVSVLK